MKTFWKNKKVLVMGAGGFIGSHVVDKLVEYGAEVTAQVSKNRKTYPNLDESINKITIVTGDLLDLKFCLDITQEKDIVLNFAAIDGGAAFKKEHSDEIYKTNSQITLNALESAKINSVGRLLLISSSVIYPSTASQPMREEYGQISDINEEVDGYVLSKRFLESEAKKYNKEFGLKICVIRPGNVYGTRDHINKGRVIPTFVNQALNNAPITLWNNGEQLMAFTYIDDFVEGALRAVEKYSVCEPLNIGSNKYISVRDLAALIIKLTKSKSKLGFMQSSQKFQNRMLDINKAEKVINFKENVDIESGLTELIDDLRSKR